MSDAPKDVKKPAAKSEGKPAAAPAADKKAAAAPAKAAAKGAAPAKAGAKGAAKGTAKVEVVKPLKYRKKNKAQNNEQAKPEPSEAEKKKTSEERKKHTKAVNAVKEANRKLLAAFSKSVKEARAKKQPAPKKPTLQRLPKKTQQAKAKPNYRFVVKLSPLDASFQQRYGFAFSAFIGKAREKALSARNVRVLINQKGHPLHGRQGKLLYYTGKHYGFVKLGYTRFKLPWSIIVRRSYYHKIILPNRHKATQSKKLRTYNRDLKKYEEEVAAAKASGDKAPAKPKSLATPVTEEPFKQPRAKKYAKQAKIVAERRAKKGKGAAAKGDKKDERPVKVLRGPQHAPPGRKQQARSQQVKRLIFAAAMRKKSEAGEIKRKSHKERKQLAAQKKAQRAERAKKSAAGAKAAQPKVAAAPKK